MITSIRCENFRCFKDTGDLRLAPITILVGENNSGKSAIIQALHLPALTLESEDKRTPLSLASMDYDYGSFSDVIFRHNENEMMTLSYGIEFDGKKPYKATFRLNFGYSPKRKEIYLNTFTIEDSSGKILEISQNKYTGSISSMYMKDYKEDSAYLSKLYTRYNFLWEPGLSPFGTQERLKRRYDKEKSEKLLSKIAQSFVLIKDIENTFRNTHHLGPLRIPARRTILYSGSSYARKVGSRGDLTLQNYSALLRRGRKEDKKLIKLINSALYQLGFISNFEIRSAGPRHYEFWTQHKASLFDANLADTGFGASQVLPVLFTLYTSTDGSILLYEQPEIHLHPAAQAELGSVFAKACSPKKRILIETHSENLILRIQTEVAEGKLNPNDVIFYYLLPETDGHRVLAIPLNEKGEFLEKWPKGFFEENYLESLKLSRARHGNKL